MIGNGDNVAMAGSIVTVPHPPARVGAVLLLGLAALQPLVGTSFWAAFSGACVVAALGIWLRTVDDGEMNSASVLVLLLYVIGLVPGLGLWPVGPLIAILLTAGLFRFTGRSSGRPEWLQIGRIDRSSWLIIAAIAVVSVIGLVLWQRVFNGELPDTYRYLAESVPWPVAVIGALGFVIINGAIEDSVFFGVLLSPILRYFPQRWAIPLIAIAFGLAHFKGVPSGLVGVALAGTWAVMLAYLRIRTRGMLATYLAHAVADATIMAILLPPLLHLT